MQFIPKKRDNELDICCEIYGRVLRDKIPFFLNKNHFFVPANHPQPEYRVFHKICKLQGVNAKNKFLQQIQTDL